MYIRTKDGRIIDTTKIVTGSKHMDFATNDESFREIFKTEPLAKSESLEELCDEFIYDYGKDKDRFKNDKLALKILKANNNDKVNIYGCIWCEFGLKYIAKLNSKGELELL